MKIDEKQFGFQLGKSALHFEVLYFESCRKSFGQRRKRFFFFFVDLFKTFVRVRYISLGMALYSNARSRARTLGGT